MTTSCPPPVDQLTLRTIAMPRDTNPSGDIFGGWLVSMMDMAGGTVAIHQSKGRVVLAGIHKMSFLLPVFVGDEVSCYVRIVKIGTTSIQVNVEAWVRRPTNGNTHKVTEGLFTFVGIDENRKPRSIPRD
ncbi:MAG: acyl-CoA thioesterase [Alphaproteobacteria bacterium]|jgi:acyl-CoA thioesterase YciA|nr:acyl-CoA thioesterase [Alphaproteobacteria bacterium]MBP7729181.1 acyl-CoA thioesterase [Alphaproteobacteria bacterium]